jgi:hypothetical protein
MGKGRGVISRLFVLAAGIAGCATDDRSVTGPSPPGIGYEVDAGSSVTTYPATYPLIEAGSVPTEPDEAAARVEAAPGWTPTCDSDAGPAPLLRPGCPAEPPIATDCPVESLFCLYAAPDAGACYDVYQCVFGLWSPRGRRCENTDSPLDPDQTDCPASVPVGDTPCDHVGSCGYGKCYDSVPANAKCVCGRWAIESFPCPDVP